MSGDNRTDTFPALERLSYFHGQLLSAQDFKDEQTYFRNKIDLLARCLHGYGVVCGLVVEPDPGAEDCPPHGQEETDELERELAELDEQVAETEQRVREAHEAGDDALVARHEEKRAAIAARIEEIRRQLDDHAGQYASAPGGGEPVVRVTPGMALDCRGNVLTVNHPMEINLRHELGNGDLRRLQRGEVDRLWVSICYCESGTMPTRPVVTHSCASSVECSHARVRETVSIRVTVDPPSADECCEPCCCTCDECGDASCLLLAVIDPVPDGRVPGETIHNEVRRMLNRHPLTTIVGVNWWHGATYTVTSAFDLIHDGLEIVLSRPVLTDTLRPGVAEVVVYEGGSGNRGGMYHVPGELEVPPAAATDRLVWKALSDETFQNGDRVIFRLRGDFVLDECCHAVDAENIGGRVPPTAEAVGPHSYEGFETCTSPPTRPGPWTSGDGTPGGLFESWIYIERVTGDPR